MKSLTNCEILVTGGAGFIGSNLVKTLCRDFNARVTVLDNLFNGNYDNIKDPNCHFVRGSVEDAALVDECVRGRDFVFHLASRNIIVSNKNPKEDLDSNVIGSFNVFEACARHKVSRVVYSSTSSIYGASGQLPLREDEQKSFLNFYSASKFCAEVYAQTFCRVHDLPVTIVRYSNVYGPNQTPVNPYCGVIGKFVDAARLDQPLKIHGTGLQTRDYTFIDDAVQATLAAATAQAAIGQDYNIGTGIETSVNMLAEYIIAATESKSEIQYIRNRDIDNVQRRAIDISKAQTELGYQPKYSVKQGLEQTLAWFEQSSQLELANSLFQ